jgi:hypothetical protein
MANIMNAKDAVSASLAECYVTIEGNRYNLMQAIKLEAKVEKTKSEVPILGKTGKGNKATGWKGTGSATFHYNMPIFRRLLKRYKLKVITGAEDESLRKSCVKRVPVPGRRNQYQQETDYNLYLGKLAVACTVYPNLNDKALQDSYKVMGAENLLKTMLTSGEYAEYLQKVQEVCGFDVPLQDEVDDAKN